MGVVEVRAGSDGAPVLGNPEELMRELDEAVERLSRDNAKHPRVPTIPLHIRALAEEARWSLEYEGFAKEDSPPPTAPVDPNQQTPRRGWSWEEWQRARAEEQAPQVPARLWLRWSAAGVAVGLSLALVLVGAMEAAPRLLASSSTVVNEPELAATMSGPAAPVQRPAPVAFGPAATAASSAHGAMQVAPPATTGPAPAPLGADHPFAVGASSPASLTESPLGLGRLAARPVSASGDAPPVLHRVEAPATTLAPRLAGPRPAETPRSVPAPKLSRASTVRVAPAAKPEPEHDVGFEDEAGELEVEVVRETTETEAPFDDPAEADFDQVFGVTSAPKKAASPRTVYVPPDPAVPASKTLTQEQILGVVLEHKADIARCVEAQREADPDSEGELVMAWKISADGTTTDVKTRTGALRGSVLAACVEDEIARWRFPAHASGEAPVVFPFRF